jgi:hypothetical protein
MPQIHNILGCHRRKAGFSLPGHTRLCVFLTGKNDVSDAHKKDRIE